MIQFPHTIQGQIDSGYISWRVICPYRGVGERSCQIYDDAPNCHDENCSIGRDLEFGHAHPTDGCGLEQYLEEGGFESIDLSSPVVFQLPPLAVTWGSDGPIIHVHPLQP